MVIILPEDTSKITPVIHNILVELGSGDKKVQREVTVGDDIAIAVATGYWVGDMIRVDIRFKR